MSKNFFVKKEELSKNPLSTNDMNEDVLEGFIQSARNNQPNLAMRYLVHILRIIDEKLPDTNIEEVAVPVVEAVEEVEEKPAAKRQTKRAQDTDTE